MFRDGSEPRDQQTAWSEEQLETFLLDLLETEKGKAVLAKVMLSHLAYHEPVKERVAQLGFQAVDSYFIKAFEELGVEPPANRA